jgi:predicted O-linked N-acetylglucosamine transferase (SPINDLY family)
LRRPVGKIPQAISPLGISNIELLTTSKKLQIYKKLLKNTEKIEQNLQKTLEKSSKLSKNHQKPQKTLENRKNIRLIPYKILKKLSKTLKNPTKKLAKNAEKIFVGNFHTPKFPYITFENKLILRHTTFISNFKNNRF